MAEYIELGAAINLIRTEGVYGEGHSDEERENDVISMLESLPSADVVEVVHGRWTKFYKSGNKVNEGWVSSCCDMWNERKSPYCPNCGARMDGDG